MKYKLLRTLEAVGTETEGKKIYAKIEDDGNITTIGGFQAFHSRYAAHAYAKETAKELKAVK